MADAVLKTESVKKTSSLVLRFGAHPIVYSVLVILAIGSAVFFFAVVPMVRTLQSGGKSSVNDATIKRDSAKNKLDSQKKIIDLVTAVSKENRDLLAYALPIEADTPGLAVQLNSLTVNSGVKMSGVDITAAEGDSSSSTSPQAVSPVSISLTLDNVSYEKVKIVLSNIEKSLRLFDVRSLTYSPSANSVTVELRTYFLKAN